MWKVNMARLLARRTHLSNAAAADGIDRFLHDLAAKVRRGEAARLPGVGAFTPGPLPEFLNENPSSPKRRKKGAHGGNR